MSAPLNLRAALRTAGWPVGIVALSIIGGVIGAQLVTNLVEPTYEARASAVVAAYALDYSDTTATAPPGTQAPAPANGKASPSASARGKSTSAATTGANAGDTRTQARPKPPVYQPNLSRSMVPTVAQYAESSTVAAATAKRLGLPLGDVLGHIESSFEAGNQIVTLTAKASTAEGAMRLANTTADVLRAQVAGGGSLARKGTLYAQPLERAVLPAAPTTPNPLLNGLLGGVLGLLLGLGLASLHRRFDDRLRTTEQITDELGLPILATVPKVGRNLVRRGARSAFRRRPVARAIRTATAALTPLTDLAGRRLMVTSAFQDDGKTFVSGLLSLGLAEQRYHVTLFEGQLRHPGLTRHFPSSAEHTVQRLIGTSEEDIASSAQVALRVIAAEPTDPEVSRALVRSQGFIQLLDNAAAHSDVVVINGPGVLASGDIAPLCAQADAAVVVVRAGTTKAPDARRALQVLRRLTIPIVGVIVTDAIDGGAGHRSPAETPLDVTWPTPSMQPALVPALTQHRVDGDAERSDARPARGFAREYAMEEETFTAEPSFARAEPVLTAEAEPVFTAEAEPTFTPEPTFMRAEPASAPEPEREPEAVREPEPTSATPAPAPTATPEPSFVRAEPAYTPEPEPMYARAEPAYRAPEPAYRAPEPAYRAPEPAYRAPEPAYRAPEPAYRAPEPAHRAPEPEPTSAPRAMYTDAEPTFAPEPEPTVTPEPSYTRTEPRYEPEPTYRMEPTYPDEGSFAAPEPSRAPQPSSSDESSFAAPEPRYRVSQPMPFTVESSFTTPERTFTHTSSQPDPEQPVRERIEPGQASADAGQPNDAEPGPDAPTRINEITGAETASHR